MSGFSNKPKILRGAFVEYGLSMPPLFTVFQFNPEQLTRSRSISYSAVGNAPAGSTDGEQSNTPATGNVQKSLRDLHDREFEGDNLLEIQNRQHVEVGEETLSFDIRLDATDDINSGDEVAGLTGIMPRLAAIERMAMRKSDSLLGSAVDTILNLDAEGFSFSKRKNPPIILFIWGHHRIVPVNITSLRIVEMEYSTILQPTRATVTVSVQVIEGKNVPFMYTEGIRDTMAVLNLKNIPEMANVVVPG